MIILKGNALHPMKHDKVTLEALIVRTYVAFRSHARKRNTRAYDAFSAKWLTAPYCKCYTHHVKDNVCQRPTRFWVDTRYDGEEKFEGDDDENSCGPCTYECEEKNNMC